MPRRPIAVIPIVGSDEDGHPDTNGFVAVCDDGATFIYSFKYGEWSRSPSVPGTAAVEEDRAIADREAVEQAEAGKKMRADLDAFVAKTKQQRKRK